MVFEALGMSFPCPALLLLNYAKVNTVFHSMAPLKSTVFNIDYLTLVTIRELKKEIHTGPKLLNISLYLPKT